ncbi:MAG: TonB-dependent receptor plug domain-containing protein, partial [Alphaproteobacteria bacterium]
MHIQLVDIVRRVGFSVALAIGVGNVAWGQEADSNENLDALALEDTSPPQPQPPAQTKAEKDAASEAAQAAENAAADASNPARERRRGGGTTSTVVDEVIVAASKRNIEAGELPVAISTLSEETLDYGGVNNTGVTAFYMPSLGIFNEPTWSFISIRGMGAGLNGGFEQSVGIIYDGVNLGRSAFMNDPLVDTQQLEVLRGPQGTVTGKNAVAGAYVVSSGKPFFEWSGKYDVSIRDVAKDGDGYDAQGVLTGPIIQDVLAFRVAYSKADVAGDLWNETLQRYEAKKDNWAARAALLLVLNDDIEVVLSHKRSNVSENGPNHDIAHVGGSFQLVMSPYGTVEDDQYNRRTARDFAGSVNRDSQITSLNIEAPFGDYKTRLILGHADQENFVGLDADWGPAPVITTETDIDYEQISAEFNISQDFADGGMDAGLPGWIAGLFYYESEYRTANSTPLLPEGGIGLTGLDLCGLLGCTNELDPLLPVTELGRNDNFSNFDQFTRSMAAFFELSLPTYVIPRTMFTIGARVTKEHKEVDFERRLPPDQNLSIWPLLIPDTSAFAANDSIDETAWTGRFSLQYFPPGDDMNLFFTASRG